jgi:rhodanese-related sulfurtransferase
MALTRRSRALAASAALLALGACSRGGSDPFALASVEDVERMLGEPGVVVIDANTPETFRKHRLPGALYWRSAPLAQLLPPEKDRRVVFYCASPS